MNRSSAGSRPGLRRLRRRKHLALLAALVTVYVAQPLLVHWTVPTRVAGDAVIVAMGVGVFLVVFEQRWERWGALLLALPGVAANFAYYALANGPQTVAVVVYHGFAAAFFGFAVAVILRGVFRQGTVQTDELIGAVCGYLLAAVVWGNLYALLHVIVPGSFHVANEIAWQLGEWHTRRSLFEYFSIVTLTGLGYGDITPTNPPAYALVSLEVVFGLFYLAVVVAQLVGLTMIRGSGNKGSS